ncbi:hypothetical protein [Amycolatopsis magusensis]|uniref:hypothetical protein n=1 Tax=Amycolatopsis magusensis TaxID=882444 RepID=UPI0024A8E933|nr:hypothetical protein [Amycolatopsis magusensis]MDI5976677.1 hypothetical protein [Amycolatopsis magusensis]
MSASVRRRPARLDHRELAGRIADLGGLYLAPPVRLLALELGPRADRPVLPMDPGTANLFDLLDVAGGRPAAVRPAACRQFLTRLQHTVAPGRDIHLICLAPPEAVFRDWLTAHPRFTASCPGTEARWADEVSQCLGHRGARGLRRRTRELEAGLRRWQHTREPAFTWLPARRESVSPVR